MSSLTELERELLEALKALKASCRSCDMHHSGVDVDALIARAEAKAKEPHDEDAPICVCAHEGWGGEDVSEICGAYIGMAADLYDVGKKEICRHCGHDRSCHSAEVR